jgi:sarcosine oxidase
MSERYDCIVLGVGGFGSAALYHAAARGLSVLGIEQFAVGHDRGSSHGETRIIRKAYFEHPNYVPLLLRTYELWRKLEGEIGRPLMHLCGLMLAGPPQGETISGARLAARIHRLRLENISLSDAKDRFPGFAIPSSFESVYEPEAGYLELENCVRAHAEAAVARGATLLTNEIVEEWTAEKNTVRVRTSKADYETRSLIITAGPWASRILSDLSLPLEVVRKPQFWFPVRSPAYAVESGCPGFYFEMPFGHFYGSPSLDQLTLKAAEHSGGEPVSDPQQVDRSIGPADLESLARFLRECLPDVLPTPIHHSVCMYTLTPDRHFIVDRHPDHANVAFGAGFSGHGFKFTPVIGEALVDLATEGRSALPIEFLSIRRESLKVAPASKSH